jgi:hypothetical protein
VIFGTYIHEYEIIIFGMISGNSHILKVRFYQNISLKNLTEKALVLLTLAFLINRTIHHRFSSKRLNNKGTIGLIIIFKVV